MSADASATGARGRRPARRARAAARRSSRTSRSSSARARSSASSASPAAARRRSRSRCSATRGRGARIAGGSVRVGGRGAGRAPRARRCGGCAGGSSPTCRRTRPRRSTRRCRIGDQIREMLRGHAPAATSGRGARPRAPAGTTATSRAASRTSSRAASSSAWRSPRRSSASRRWSCSTSRRPASTSSPRRASSTRSAGCARELGLAMVYVSHDLAVVGAIADRIAVMYAGRVVEEGAGGRGAARRPRHPYTRGLVASIPDHAAAAPAARHPGRRGRRRRAAAGLRVRAALPAARRRLRRGACRRSRRSAPGARVALHPLGARRRPCRGDAPPRAARRGGAGARRCSRVEGLRAEHRTPRRARRRGARTSPSRSRAAQCVALVGESGSGKTTIARCVAGLHAPSAGAIAARRRARWRGSRRGRTREQRRRDPDRLPEPGRLAQPAPPRARRRSRAPARILLRPRPARGATAEVAALLERVRLPARLADRYPRELSGGERQRVAIARALAAAAGAAGLRRGHLGARRLGAGRRCSTCSPSCARELGLALLFISHDLGVVASVADRVLVLDRGRVCEEGPAGDPAGARRSDAYTRALVAAAPTLPAYGDSPEV